MNITYAQLRDKIDSRFFQEKERRQRWHRLNPSGKSKRALARRKFLYQLLDVCLSKPKFNLVISQKEWEHRKTNKALGLARMANRFFDEHGSTSGDYRTTIAIDYVPPADAKSSPYFDMGNGGLGVIEVIRKRVYARSSKWFPSTVSEFFLVGRNEAGTFFAHRVSSSCSTVKEAIAWMWNGMESRIIARQGDVALIHGNGGPRYPPNGLPLGHRVSPWGILHKTHPTIPVPGKKQRIVVAKRAAQRGDGATSQTRD